MRIIVIGLGSMGKRRIRLIRKHDNSINLIGVDNNQVRRKECEENFNISTYASLPEIDHIEQCDAAFVCSAPLTHNEIIRLCLDYGLHVFSELNLVDDGYDYNIALAAKKGLILFMSSTFLYREEIKKIKALTNQSDCKLNYNYHIGQYLPDWHPWENYNNFFVGDKRSNGCREIFAIELPWLVDVFGEIINIKVIKSKMSSLSIEYNDNYLLIIQHASGHNGTLAIDVVSRKPVRNLEIYGENLFLHWDGSPKGLFLYDYEAKKDINVNLYSEIDQLNNYSSFVVENAYLNEIISFFDSINSNNQPCYDFKRDKEILKLIDKIEE